MDASRPTVASSRRPSGASTVADTSATPSGGLVDPHPTGIERRLPTALGLLGRELGEHQRIDHLEHPPERHAPDRARHLQVDQPGGLLVQRPGRPGHAPCLPRRHLAVEGKAPQRGQAVAQVQRVRQQRAGGDVPQAQCGGELQGAELAHLGRPRATEGDEPLGSGQHPAGVLGRGGEEVGVVGCEPQLLGVEPAAGLLHPTQRLDRGDRIRGERALVEGARRRGLDRCSRQVHGNAISNT